MFSFGRTAQFVCALHFIFLYAANSTASAVELHPGDLVVDAWITDASDYEILRVDPATGAKTVISSKSVGSGPTITSNSVLALGPSGQIYAASAGKLYRIDPATGDRTIVSDATHGSGTPDLGDINALQTLQDGSLLVCSYGNELIRVDAITGNRTLPPPLASDPPNFSYATGLSIAPNGDVWIADAQVLGVLRYNVDTGEHSIVSRSIGLPVGTGPSFNQPRGQTFNLTGDLFYVKQELNILSIDPITGNREIVSSWDPLNLVGAGGYLDGGATRIQPDGSLLVLNNSNGFYRVDPDTGDRTLQFAFAPGENLWALDFVVVPHAVPEPSTFALAAVGCGALLAIRIRRLATP